MTCSGYAWYSPSGWICNGADALMKGIVGGAGNELEEAVKRATSHLFSELQQYHFAENAGKGINQGINEFLHNLDVEKIFSLSSEELKKGIQGGIRSAHFGETSQLASDEFERVFEIFRKSAFKEINGLSSDIQGVFATAARDTTLKMIPWIASGIMMISAAPLLTYYIYLKAKHSIGKPKLATRVHYAGYVDRAMEKLSNVTSEIYHSIVPGVKWTALSAAVAYGCFVPSMILCQLEWLPMCQNSYRTIDRFRDNYLGMANFGPLVIGAASATYNIGSRIFSGLKNWVTAPSEAKPIFNPELEARIQEITTATYNLKRNGGYFQNLLLFGPGGTGKTMVAERIARNSGMNYIMMSGGDLAQYIKRGEHVTELNKMFDSIQRLRTPTILFIDEIESLARDRSKMDKAELFELLNAFLSRTGTESNKFMLIGATNRPELLDAAFLSRMDHKLEIGVPHVNERMKILQQYIQRFFSRSEITQFFSDKMTKKMAQNTDGLTGRTMFKMLNALSCQKMATQDRKMTQEMIDKVVQQFVSQEQQVFSLQKE